MAGTVSGVVIQTFRYLGKMHVPDETMKRLVRRLSVDDRKQMLKDPTCALAWIADIMRRLAVKE